MTAKIRSHTSGLIRILACNIRKGNSFYFACNRKAYYRHLIERDLQEVQIIECEGGLEVKCK